MSDPGQAGRTLASASRNDWLTHNLARASACFQILGLEFMTRVDGEPQSDRSGTRWIVTSLDKTEVETARDGIESFLKLAAAKPGDLGGALNPAVDSEEILSALDAPEGPAGEDEGDGPVYLFAFIKDLRSLLDYAEKHGLWVIHARHVY